MIPKSQALLDEIVGHVGRPWDSDWLAERLALIEAAAVAAFLESEDAERRLAAALQEVAPAINPKLALELAAALRKP